VFRLKRIQIVEKASGDYSKFLPVRGTFTRLLDVDWCPVGDRLLVETSDSLQRITLWTISTRGENQQRVLQDSVMLEGATWSARGDAIDYFRQSQGQGAALWKVRIDPKRGTPTGRPRLLLDGLRVDAGSISREGGRLACTRSLEYSNLWRLNWKLDTRSPKRWQMEPMTSGTAVNESPSVSPMGDRVVFVREGAEGSDLWTASIRGGDAYQLTHGIRSVASPVWSPDGSKIAFAGEQGGALRVWVVGADGLRSRCYSQTLLDADWSLTWSRTKGVLYVGLGHRRIDGLDPVTGGTRTFIPEGALQWVYSPKVSPDGNRVVLSTSHHGLCVVDAADPTKLLLCTPTVALPFGWDSTGRTIFAFIPPSPRILEISAESGVVVPLPEPGVPAGMKVSTLSAAPDGRTFIYALSQSVSDVVLVEGFDPDAR